MSSFQKVGTFRIAGVRKQGGNVASYFTTPKGQVLHVIAGPVNAHVFLLEARWVVEMWKLAALEKQVPTELFFRKAHLERLQQMIKNAIDVGHRGHNMGMEVVAKQYGQQMLKKQLNSRPAKVHQLLAMNPLPRIEDIYRLVFEKILHQQLSTAPVNNG